MSMSPKERLERSKRAAERLSDILYNVLKVDVRPSHLGDFINTRWNELSLYAHQIHAARDITKGNSRD